MFNPRPEILVKYLRGTLVEEEHYGFRMLANKERVLEYSGETGHYPFYLRSCAKPLQASLLIDYGMDIKYDMSDEEIAICCASHAGEDVHLEVERNLLNKLGIDETFLKCGLHKPLSKTKQDEMLLKGEVENVLHNNCAGKHIMMLGLCKMNGWDLTAYDEEEHPLQIKIKEKITELCELKHRFPMTKDGCGVPIMSMPLEDMLRGYLNLFTNPRYEKIKNAFLNHPYLIGGENRLDTKIIQNSENIIAKVGAGGLCIVVNLEKEEAFVVKISDCDMKAREYVVVQSLKNLHWADISSDMIIRTIHGETVGQIVAM
ncbi:hypothetical protein DBY21_04490 [Candidatus Gastranaerophilales bacterium]|nr:MAG: hypothetical protein DBY21_04490 [Candidatus Gastranaerophilales bacterium]